MFRSVTPFYTALPFAFVCTLASQAHAHEPPHGVGLLWPANAEADATPTILTNRGLIFLNDGGASRFSIRCSESYGAVSGVRPDVMLDDQGDVVVATTLDVQRTSDRACTFTPATGLPNDPDSVLTGNSLGGFAVDPSKPGRALMSEQAYKTLAHVYVSEDYARTWSPLSTNTMYSTYRYLMVAEDGLHVIASGSRYDAANKKTVSIYAYSTDGAKTWIDADTETTRQPLGFLPGSPNIVFMREALPNATINSQDRLLRSTDGGKTFTTIGDPFITLGAFAATPDGKTVWVGSRFGGLFQSDDSGLTFTQIKADMINGADCLYYRQETLWACANIKPNQDGIFVSKDLGQTFNAHMVFEEVKTQVDCTDGEICEQAWYDWEYELNNGWNSTDGGSAPRPDASVAGGNDAGIPQADSGGSSEEPLDAGAKDAGHHDAGRVTAAKKDDGCSLGGRTDGGLWLLALAALLARRRR